MQESSFQRWRVVIGVALILSALFLWGFISRYEKQKQVDAIANADPLPKVKVIEIKESDKPIELVLPTSAVGWHTTPIWSRVNGYLLKYLVDIGDAVKQGDLLAEIDTPETDQLLEQARADLANSVVERDIAKITSDRWSRLYEKNQEAVAKQEVDQYLANLESAEALVLANEKNVAKYEYQQQFKYLYAPFDGIITNRFVDIGSLIYGAVNGLPQELFQLSQAGQIRFFVDVPQTYFQEVQDGVDAEVTILELPGKVFKGKVDRFAKALSPDARTLLTQVNVDNSDGLLYPGLFGKMRFSIKVSYPHFIVPTTAIIILDGPPEVAVVDKDSVVHLKKVQIGRDYGNQMEIVLGIQAGDKVIAIPSDRITEGVKVDVVQ